MSRHATQVFIAVAVSAFLGAIVGWWIFPEVNIAGLLTSVVAGGAFGYVLFDLESIAKAIPAAIRYANCKAMKTYHWRPSDLLRFKLKLAFKFAPLPLLYCSSLLSWGIIGGLVLGTILFKDTTPIIFFGFVTLWIVAEILLAIAVTTMVTFSFALEVNNKVGGLRRYIEARKDLLKSSLTVNPIAVCYHYLPLGFQYLPCFILSFVSLLTYWSGYFIWSLYKAIHCDLRLICLIDAAIFAGTGYLSGSPYLALLISIAAGAFSLFNYAVIAKHWLRTLPTEA